MTFNGWNLDASRAIPAARVALRGELEAKAGDPVPKEERRRRERLADGTLLLWEANFVPLARPFWTSFDMTTCSFSFGAQTGQFHFIRTI
jgi:hypothetical protein